MPASEVPDADALLAHAAVPRVSTGLRINVIWKDVTSPTMIVSSGMHIPVQGDANIAKYLCRTGAPSLYPEDFAAATEIDGFVDAAVEIASGNAKTQKKTMKDPNTALGKVRLLPPCCYPAASAAAPEPRAPGKRRLLRGSSALDWHAGHV